MNDYKIRIENITAGYGKLVVLKDISFDIGKKDFIVVTGPNGGGKTSLLKVILGLLKPLKGKIIFSDKNIQRNVGYIPQANSIDKRFPITVGEVISSGLCNSMETKNGIKEKTYSIAEKMGVEKLLHRGIGELSGGQLQRVLIARAMICLPELLVLDEPNSYVDEGFKSFLYKLLADINRKTIILMVSHETEKLEGIAKRIIYIDKTNDKQAYSLY